jgi:hypothetical protein
LLLRVEGHSRAAWDHTASLMCLIANVNRDPKRRSDPWRVEDFHPHLADAAGGAGGSVPNVGIGVLKMFVT